LQPFLYKKRRWHKYLQLEIGVHVEVKTRWNFDSDDVGNDDGVNLAPVESCSDIDVDNVVLILVLPAMAAPFT
jgi:hypothetical protein